MISKQIVSFEHARPEMQTSQQLTIRYLNELQRNYLGQRIFLITDQLI